MGKNIKVKFDEAALKRAADDAVRKKVLEDVEVTCPSCHAKAFIQGGRGRCPSCGTEIILQTP